KLITERIWNYIHISRVITFKITFDWTHDVATSGHNTSRHQDLQTQGRAASIDMGIQTIAMSGDVLNDIGIRSALENASKRCHCQDSSTQTAAHRATHIATEAHLVLELLQRGNSGLHHEIGISASLMVERLIESANFTSFWVRLVPVDVSGHAYSP
ncbi:hypothetical protein DENSPDRAFT_855609, partial [Dentipellis sp. KUC8613]